MAAGSAKAKQVLGLIERRTFGWVSESSAALGDRIFQTVSSVFSLRCFRFGSLSLSSQLSLVVNGRCRGELRDCTQRTPARFRKEEKMSGKPIAEDVGSDSSSAENEYDVVKKDEFGTFFVLRILACGQHHHHHCVIREHDMNEPASTTPSSDFLIFCQLISRFGHSLNAISKVALVVFAYMSNWPRHLRLATWPLGTRFSCRLSPDPMWPQ